MRDQKLKFLVVDSLFAVIIALLAQVAIPLGPIPLTGQTFAVGLAATILGAKHGTISVIVYIILGAVGIPVFQGMTAGIGIIFGPTGGFIIGFIFSALLTGWILQKTKFTVSFAIIANILGALVTLMFGVLWLKVSTGLDWPAAFLTGMVPFIIPGIIKAVFAAILGIIIRDRLLKAKLLKAS
ncbi:biotin transporter BioY [Listeria immobilis]|uniref:Biotin transporter n=1 Tax=Listeria immobilis TaxID=2713502 RepID=A0ABR6STT2_9LIST|nr:biotin transporter BioY [Listeria immobilis]MBC1482092.1 biotin transporter BioY [Listeria immobilis]MBC1505483.1 biotin transporter BioY [Listeria immobilis]MBC1509084.1 biotin transporter BioY [Listeria immobilis]MBC1514633.1 biotin transporter BioY [Listeria immobilis]MBC6303792.1 biotin transporter BioY [Listeria immobilis]